MTQMLENPMVIGEYYPAPNPTWKCPKCHREWQKFADHREGGYTVYGYECDDLSTDHHPAHGNGCECCVWDDRTVEDAMAFALEKRPEELHRLIASIVVEMGVKRVLQMLHEAEPTITGYNAEEWADEQDDYREWLINNK